MIAHVNKNDLIRVLIVEDNSDQSTLLHDAMEMEGDIVCCGQAKDGVEALEALRREEPDVLLMDNVMPNMDGLELLSRLRAQSLSKRPRIIVMSAFLQESIVKEAFSYGADYFLLKPYQYDGLFKRIRAVAKQGEPARCFLPDHPDYPYRPNQAISSAVMELGIPTNMFGYAYLEQALMILLSHQGTCLIGKDVYGTIAGPNRTTVQCVEKALRKVIREAFVADSEALHRILKLGGVENVKHLSNGRFLTLMAESLRQGRS